MPTPALMTSQKPRTRDACIAQLRAWARGSYPMHTFVLLFDDDADDEGFVIADRISAFDGTPGLDATSGSDAYRLTVSLRAPVSTEASTLIRDLWDTRAVNHGIANPELIPCASH